MEPVVDHAYPILHVHFRWQDRPGATLNVLDAISSALQEALPRSRRRDWSVSYARLRVLTGQVATARLTIRMHIPEARHRGLDRRPHGGDRQEHRVPGRHRGREAGRLAAGNNAGRVAAR